MSTNKPVSATGNGVKKQEDGESADSGPKDEKRDVKPVKTLNRVPRKSPYCIQNLQLLTIHLAGACVRIILKWHASRILSDEACIECLSEAKDAMRGCGQPPLSTMSARRIGVSVRKTLEGADINRRGGFRVSAVELVVKWPVLGLVGGNEFMNFL